MFAPATHISDGKNSKKYQLKTGQIKTKLAILMDIILQFPRTKAREKTEETAAKLGYSFFKFRNKKTINSLFCITNLVAMLREGAVTKFCNWSMQTIYTT